MENNTVPRIYGPQPKTQNPRFNLNVAPDILLMIFHNLAWLFRFRFGEGFMVIGKSKLVLWTPFKLNIPFSHSLCAPNLHYRHPSQESTDHIIMPRTFNSSKKLESFSASNNSHESGNEVDNLESSSSYDSDNSSPPNDSDESDVEVNGWFYKKEEHRSPKKFWKRMKQISLADDDEDEESGKGEYRNFSRGQDVPVVETWDSKQRPKGPFDRYSKGTTSTHPVSTPLGPHRSHEITTPAISQAFIDKHSQGNPAPFSFANPLIVTPVEPYIDRFNGKKQPAPFGTLGTPPIVGSVGFGSAISRPTFGEKSKLAEEQALHGAIFRGFGKDEMLKKQKSTVGDDSHHTKIHTPKPQRFQSLEGFLSVPGQPKKHYLSPFSDKIESIVVEADSDSDDPFGGYDSVPLLSRQHKKGTKSSTFAEDAKNIETILTAWAKDPDTGGVLLLQAEADLIKSMQLALDTVSHWWGVLKDEQRRKNRKVSKSQDRKRE